MRLLITDLTDMSPGHYCVAGWDVDAHRMVRPLPGGYHWSADLIAQHGITPGLIIDVSPTGQPHPGAYPHLTEDTEINPASIHVIFRGPFDWFGPGAPVVAKHVEGAFGGHVQCNSEYNGTLQGVYVPTGVQAVSLAAIVIHRYQIEFVEPFDKLKAILHDGVKSFQLAVSSHTLKTAWSEGGVDAVKAALPGGPHFHVRLGLARGYGEEADKCYMMLNGVNG